MAFGYDPAATFGAGFTTLVLALSLWEIAWKGFGMWRAARNGHKIWFVAILVLNTLGILPIIYYFFFSERKPQHDLLGKPKSAAADWVQSQQRLGGQSKTAAQSKPAAKARKKR